MAKATGKSVRSRTPPSCSSSHLWLTFQEAPLSSGPEGGFELVCLPQVQCRIPCVQPCPHVQPRVQPRPHSLAGQDCPSCWPHPAVPPHLSAALSGAAVPAAGFNLRSPSQPHSPRTNSAPGAADASLSKRAVPSADIWR